MKPEEALKTVGGWIAEETRERKYAELVVRPLSEALMTLKEMVDKQIPQKPLHIHRNYYCPVCQEDGWIMWDDAIPNDMDNYCGICGQKIDWEGTLNE